MAFYFLYILLKINMWSNEEFNIAVDLVKSGKTYNEISKVLGKSAHAIKCKLLKNKIKSSDFIQLKKYKKVNCLNCSNEIIGDGRKFCNSSCAASFNNKITKRKELAKKYCLNCGKQLKRKNIKFCNNICSGDYIYKNSIDKWKNNESESIYSDGQTPHYIRTYLFQKFDNKCSKCGWGEKNEHTGKIPLEVEHIDGDSKNNKEENLTLLCPNCHSLTKTYKGANRGNGRHNRRERYKENKSY